MHRRHRDRREGSWLLCPSQGGPYVSRRKSGNRLRHFHFCAAHPTLTLRYRAQVRNNNEFLFATVRSIAACVTVKADRGSARAWLKKSAIKCRLFDVKAQASPQA